MLGSQSTSWGLRHVAKWGAGLGRKSTSVREKRITPKVRDKYTIKNYVTVKHIIRIYTCKHVAVALAGASKSDSHISLLMHDETDGPVE